MNTRIKVILLVLSVICSAALFAAATDPPAVKAVDFKTQSAVLADPRTQQDTKVLKMQNVGPWTLMAVIQDGGRELAVLENLVDRRGSLVYTGTQGIVATLPKTLEWTNAPAGTLYGGRALEDLVKQKRDVLAEEILSKPGDPTWEVVAAALPPLRVPTFVGTRYSVDKPTYDYGAFSDEIYVDVGKVFTEIQKARDNKDVWEGLIGGWLPVVRFLFPAGNDRAWEVVIFAEEDPAKFWTQPVWYRVLLIEGGQLKEAHQFYHHLPFPPRGEPDAADLYRALLKVHTEWRRSFNPSMKVDVPDKRISDFCLHSLVREMITRVGDHPKYGYPPLGGIDVFGGYGYSNVDTFQDTFNSSVTAFLEWGAFDVAGRYIDNYFSNFVRDDGSIDTRGPEIGQYGRMLTVFAKHYSYTRDDRLIRKHQKKLEAIIKLFDTLRDESKKVPPEDASYGIIRGWSEHDSGLKVNPYQYMLPHFSNNAEASRGFHDLGQAWIELGKRTSDAALSKTGARLVQEAEAMKKDLFTSMAKSVDRKQNPPYMPAVVGDTPTWGKGRVYSELLHSGVLSEEYVRIIKEYAAANAGRTLGLPGGGMRLGGFLNSGHAYGILQNDWVREYILFYYAQMAHVYSRGAWTAVEGGRIDGTVSGPYATPSQVSIPIMTKWMLAFEEPFEETLWLAKSTPRAWLEQGQKISVSGTPTRFGTVAYEMQSAIQQGKVSAVIELPDGYSATTKVRFRTPGEGRMKSVTLNGKEWKDFSAAQEVVTIPPGLRGQVRLEVAY
jgi:hypothetical protein